MVQHNKTLFRIKLNGFLCTMNKGKRVYERKMESTAYGSFESNYEEKQATEDINLPNKHIDGGWGWVIVAGSGLSMFLVSGMYRATGFIYEEFLKEYKQSASMTSSVIALNGAVEQLTGPFVAFLCVRFGHRFVGILGGIISFLGWMTSAIVPSLSWQILTFSILIGSGYSLIIGATYSMISMYFIRNRAIANVICITFFGGIGFTCFGPLFVKLISEYGFRDAMFIIAALNLNICVTGALLRPLEDPVPEVENDYNMLTPPDSSDKMTLRNVLSNSLDPRLLSDFKITSCILMISISYMLDYVKNTFQISMAMELGLTSYYIYFTFYVCIPSGIPLVLLAGMAFDSPKLRKHKRFMFAALGISAGFACILIPLASSHGMVLGISSWFVCMILNEVQYGVQNAMLSDMVDTHQITQAIGMARLFQGLAMLLGCLFGFLREITDTSTSVYYFLGILMILTAVTFLYAIRNESRPSTRKDNRN